jgi:hypothetical protein
MQVSLGVRWIIWSDMVFLASVGSTAFHRCLAPYGES